MKFSLRTVAPAVSFVLGLANWVTFLALLVHVQMEGGAVASSTLFIAQTVPSLLLAGNIARSIPTQLVEPSWVGCQLALGILTISTSFVSDKVLYIYLYAAFSMLLRSIANPLFFTIISHKVSSTHRPDVMRSVSAASTISMALGPAAGGALMDSLGVNGLLFFSAFLTSAGTLFMFISMKGISVVQGRGNEEESEEGSARKNPGLLNYVRFISIRELAVSPSGEFIFRYNPAASWVLLLLAGAIFNAIETPLAFNHFKLSEGDFGVLIGAYGIGGMIALIFSLPKNDHPPLKWIKNSGVLISTFLGMIFISVSIYAPTGSRYFLYASFLSLGYGVSSLSGMVRSKLDDLAFLDVGMGPREIWTWASQITLFINFLTYFSFAAIYSLFNFHKSFILAVPLAYACLIYLFKRPSLRI